MDQIINKYPQFESGSWETGFNTEITFLELQGRYPDKIFPRKYSLAGHIEFSQEEEETLALFAYTWKHDKIRVSGH